MNHADALEELDVSDVAPQQACEAGVVMEDPSRSFQPLPQLLPEIHIDTSRLDGLLSGFQRRLHTLETSFARVAELAAEAAHKVIISSPRSTTSPRRSRSPAPTLGGRGSPVNLVPTGELSTSAVAHVAPETKSADRDRDASRGASFAPKPEQTPGERGAAADAQPSPGTPGEPPPLATINMASITTEGLVIEKSSVAEPAAAQAVEGAPHDNSAVEGQVEALWDAMKWMEDRMEKIDAERREELQEASRAAAQNTARGEVAKMDRERIVLALEDRPLRSELESLNDLHEGRLRAAQSEFRQNTAEKSSRLQESLHAKIDQLYKDTSEWRKRSDGYSESVDHRLQSLEEELEEYDLNELEGGKASDGSTIHTELQTRQEEPAATPAQISSDESLSGQSMSPRSARGRRSILAQKVRSKRQSGIQKMDNALENVKTQEMELSMGVASVRAGLADLLLRVEEGEMLRDQLVREVDDRTSVSGQEVEVNLSLLKQELLEEVAASQASFEELKIQQNKAVTLERLDEAIRGSEPIRHVVAQASSLVASVSALSATLEGTGKKLAEVEAAYSQDLKDSERRASARSQAITNAQAKTNQELDERLSRMKVNKADEEALRETREEIVTRLRTLEDVTAAGQKDARDVLRYEIEAVTKKIIQVEGVAEAVRADLSPEIGEVQDGIERVHADLKRALEGHRHVLDGQDAKVAAFSGQVGDACSSVRSDVRDMLVCLVSGSRRRELERADNPDEDAGMAKVAAVVHEQQQLREESARRVENANIGLTVMVRKLERSVHVLSSRDLFWEASGNKLNAHAEAFGDACCRTEAVSDGQDRFVLTTELQEYVAGNTQRVAKLIAQQADFEVIQKLTVATNIERGAADWDRRVQAMRGAFLERFLADARRRLDKKYPAQGPFGTRNRDRFFLKVEQGLKVAMSRYRSVDVGNTLFGKVKLDPACIACDRPFGTAFQATRGDARAAPLDRLPPTRHVKDAMAGHPRQSDTPSDGTTRPPEPFLDPANGGGGSTFGGRQKNATKFIYRGGFKFPKELTPMTSVDSSGAAANTWGEFSGAHSNGSAIAGGGFGHCAAPAFDTDPSRDKSRGGVNLRDRGCRPRETGVALGLEGVISTSRIWASSTSERTSASSGDGREGGKRPRPRTAGATVGRRDSSSPAAARGIEGGGATRPHSGEMGSSAAGLEGRESSQISLGPELAGGTAADEAPVAVRADGQGG